MMEFGNKGVDCEYYIQSPNGPLHLVGTCTKQNSCVMAYNCIHECKNRKPKTSQKPIESKKAKPKSLLDY